MSEPSDYQTAALAALRAGPQNAAAPEVKPAADAASNTLKLGAVTGENMDQGPGTKGPAEEPEVDEKEQPVKELPPKSPSIRKSLEQIAREKAALRAEKEAVRPLQGLQARLGPQGVHQLEQALSSGNTAEIIKALGIRPGDVQFEAAKEVVQGAKKTDPEVEAIRQELAELKQARQREQMEIGRKRTLELTTKLATEYEWISDDPKAHDEALGMVEDFIRKHGEMPAATREESLRLALADVNERYEKEAEAWEKRLTRRKSRAITPEESPEQSTPAVSEFGGSRINNSMATAPSRAPAKTQPKSDDDYRNAALAVIRSNPR